MSNTPAANAKKPPPAANAKNPPPGSKNPPPSTKGKGEVPAKKKPFYTRPAFLLFLLVIVAGIVVLVLWLKGVIFSSSPSGGSPPSGKTPGGNTPTGGGGGGGGGGTPSGNNPKPRGPTSGSGGGTPSGNSPTGGGGSPQSGGGGDDGGGGSPPSPSPSPTRQCSTDAECGGGNNVCAMSVDNKSATCVNCDNYSNECPYLYGGVESTSTDKEMLANAKTRCSSVLGTPIDCNTVTCQAETTDQCKHHSKKCHKRVQRLDGSDFYYRCYTHGDKCDVDTSAGYCNNYFWSNCDEWTNCDS